MTNVQNITTTVTAQPPVDMASFERLSRIEDIARIACADFGESLQ